MKPHKHAALMAEYAKDATQTETPWELWEWGDQDGWNKCSGSPLWNISTNYRRKPRTININGIEVPEPLRVAPEKEAMYYTPEIMNKKGEQYIESPWENDRFDQRRLKAGICHLTREAAELHARALLSFTETKP